MRGRCARLLHGRGRRWFRLGRGGVLVVDVGRMALLCSSCACMVLSFSVDSNMAMEEQVEASSYSFTSAGRCGIGARNGVSTVISSSESRPSAIANMECYLILGLAPEDMLDLSWAGKRSTQRRSFCVKGRSGDMLTYLPGS